jgi:hypothetical protein
MKVQQLPRNAPEPFKPQTANVTRLEELMELPWIKPVAQSGGIFHRFSSKNMDGYWLLLADWHGSWRVIAIVSGDDAEQILNKLPVWTCSEPRST